MVFVRRAPQPVPRRGYLGDWSPCGAAYVRIDTQPSPSLAWPESGNLCSRVVVVVGATFLAFPAP